MFKPQLPWNSDSTAWTVHLGLGLLRLYAELILGEKERQISITNPNRYACSLAVLSANKLMFPSQSQSIGLGSCLIARTFQIFAPPPWPPCSIHLKEPFRSPLPVSFSSSAMRYGNHELQHPSDVAAIGLCFGMFWRPRVRANALPGGLFRPKLSTTEHEVHWIFAAFYTLTWQSSGS